MLEGHLTSCHCDKRKKRVNIVLFLSACFLAHTLLFFVWWGHYISSMQHIGKCRSQPNISKETLLSSMYLPNPSATGRMWHKINFKWSTAGLNSGFRWIEAFHMGISTIWTQDIDSIIVQMVKKKIKYFISMLHKHIHTHTHTHTHIHTEVSSWCNG